MKLSKIGKLHQVNSENKFINNNYKDISQSLINLFNVCLHYIKLEMDVETLHSIYLRGSCLELDINDKRIFDMDINVVFEDESTKRYIMKNGYKQKIIDKMNELYGFSIYPDIAYFSKPLWLSPYYSINKFYAKKMYGSEDLSLTSLDINEVLLNYQQDIKYTYKICLSYVKQYKNYSAVWIMKPFYRIFGGLELLKKGMFSRSIYYCHNALMKRYPQYSDSLEEISYLFLNPGDFDNFNFDKFEEFVRFIYSNIGGISRSEILNNYTEDFTFTPDMYSKGRLYK